MGRLGRAGRVLATGLCFATFGLGALVVWLVLFVVSLVVRERDTRVAVGRDLIRLGFRFFVWLMTAMGVLTYELRHRERLGGRSQLILANHPTLIDVIFLMAVIPRADCVVKASLTTNPFTGGPIRAAGYVSNDAGMALIKDSLASLGAGNTLIIFPEGTRTRRGQPLALQRGAANIAVRAPVDVTPVVIHCEPLTLGKGEKWYNVPPRRPHFTLEVREDIPVAPFIKDARSLPVAARTLTQYLTTYFEEARRGGPGTGAQAVHHRHPEPGGDAAGAD